MSEEFTVESYLQQLSNNDDLSDIEIEYWKNPKKNLYCEYLIMLDTVDFKKIKNFYLLGFSNLQNYNICITAINKSRNNMKYINIDKMNFTYPQKFNICCTALNSNGELITMPYIIKEFGCRIYDLFIIAINQSPDAIRFVFSNMFSLNNEELYSLCLISIIRYDKVMEYMTYDDLKIFTPEQIFFLCTIAVKQDSITIYYILKEKLIPNERFYELFLINARYGVRFCIIKHKLSKAGINDDQIYELLLVAAEHNSYAYGIYDNVKKYKNDQKYKVYKYLAKNNPKYLIDDISSDKKSFLHCKKNYNKKLDLYKTALGEYGVLLNNKEIGIEQTLELCEIALSSKKPYGQISKLNDGCFTRIKKYALECVNPEFLSYDIYKKAVQHCGKSIQFVDFESSFLNEDQKKALCQFAYIDNNECIEYIPEEFQKYF